MNEPTYGTYQEADAQAAETELQQVGHGARRRVPVLSHDRTKTAATLGDPKGRLGRGARKALLYLRSYRIKLVEPLVPIAEPVRFARQLTGLKLTQLVRRQKKFARMSSTSRHLLEKMAPDSSFRPRLQAHQDDCLGFLNQVTAEIKARELACQGRLAETTV